MKDQNTSLSALNAVLDQIVRDWISIVNLDVEFCFAYDDDDPNPCTSAISGYQADAYNFADFGSCVVGDEGPIAVTSWPNLGGKTAIISTSIRVNFPEPLMRIFKHHVSQELFEHPFEYVAFDCKIDLPDVERYSIMMYLSGAVRNIQLDAYSETVLRKNASALMVALEPYALWFEFAAHLADDLEDANKRALLIKHLRVICAYLDCSGDLSFAKLTTLCGVAGSLQPAASLIQKKMPELVV